MTVVLAGVLLVMTLLGALGSWMLKLASASGGAAIRTWHLYAGAAGYGLAALLNIWVLRHADLSVVLPLTSLTYVWTLAIGHFALGERLTARRVGGVLAILVGVTLIARF